MPLYWAPCIAYGAIRYYLPPALTLKDSWGQNVDVVSPPYANKAYIVEVNDNQAVRLSIEAKSVWDTRTQRAVLDWMNEVRQHLRGRTFALYLFHDRGYQKCALEGADLEIPLRPLLNREISLNIVSEDYMTTELEPLTFPGGYENDYPYASVVGRPLGEASGGGPIIVSQSSYQTPSGHFPGIVSVTAEGEDQSIIVGGSVGSQWSLESIQILSADAVEPPTGPTTVAVGLTPVGTVGMSIAATVGAAEKYSPDSVGSPITVTAGSRLYVRVTAAGGHNDVQYMVRLKAL